jgi:hypothetical protein
MNFAERSPNAFDMLWGASWSAPQSGTTTTASVFPLDRYFRDAEVVTYA